MGSFAVAARLTELQEANMTLTTSEVLARHTLVPDRERYLRDVLEGLPVAIYTTDAAGRITFYNSAAAGLAGHRPVLGKDEWCVSWRLYRPDGTPLPHDQCPMAIALREGRPVRGVEALLERPDGTRVPFLPYPTPLWSASGVLVGAVNLLVDLSAQHAVQAELRRLNETLEQRVAERTAALSESNRNFRLLVQSVTDYAIFMLDRNGFVANWNPGAQRIKGYAAHEIIGQHYSRFYTEHDRKNRVPDRALEAARLAGKYESEGVRVRKDGGTFWASVVVDAIYDESGEVIGFAKVTRDLTERRAAEEQLRHAQKMEALGQLTGGIAHDFNNMLTPVMAHLDLIAVRATNETLRRQALAALRSVERAARLTHRLLAFSRKQHLEPIATNLSDLVSGMSEMLACSLGGTIRIELALGEKLWPTSIDPAQIESAILNLAINARDAMADAGTLTIETSNVHFGPLHCPVELKPGDYVMVSVTDTGTGMSDEVRARAFDPFFTTKAIGKGTGLGLSQVYGIVGQSGGAAEIQSAIGRGTTVRLYLPRLRESVETQRSEGRRPTNAPSCSGAHILVVEDDDDVREAIVESLSQFGYHVTAVGSGGTALDRLHSGLFDAVIMDFAMPGMNGGELAPIVRARWPDLPILLITGHVETASFQGNKGWTAMLRKPFAAADIDAKLCGLIGRVQSSTANVVQLRPTAG
jgi:PAS domain S-box-containing protein